MIQQPEQKRRIACREAERAFLFQNDIRFPRCGLEDKAIQRQPAPRRRLGKPGVKSGRRADGQIGSLGRVHKSCSHDCIMKSVYPHPGAVQAEITRHRISRHGEVAWHPVLPLVNGGEGCKVRPAARIPAPLP